MNAQHTPGPWRFTNQPNAKRARGNFLTVLLVSDECPICDVNRHRSASEANARLISAAPDMLTALETALAELTRQEKSHREMQWNLSADCCRQSANVVRAAIAMATQAPTTEATSAAQP